MFLHRLRQLLSQVFMRLSRRLHSSSTNSPERESQLATPAGYHQSTVTNLPASGLASARWLDDTRRMRPRSSTTDGWAARDGQNPSTRSGRPNTVPLASLRPQDRAVGRPNSTHETSAPTSRPEYPTMPPAGSGTSAPTPRAPTPRPEYPTMPPASTDDQPASNEGGRRLMALKYLVRLGIYNEGFASSSVPDQYQHSLGMDESRMVDSHENLGSDGGAGNRG
jgi:hypothetical protein